jgi:hypothetical protein
MTDLIAPKRPTSTRRESDCNNCARRSVEKAHLGELHGKETKELARREYQSSQARREKPAEVEIHRVEKVIQGHAEGLAQEPQEESERQKIYEEEINETEINEEENRALTMTLRAAFRR